ncbi:AAA family ATPase [Gracilibacillus sp. S3-1-1]|uniref:AAA family ATPase n=1 Tax=Gracilibacillus pellucidus TaxID=3095368 RepID=A0ACC6M406_9BACI|nr:AAA family ATPase [Gracilibacillus sp. S3-1-1]MDX8045703.1 AAA family ATPase [Gracilibacillus sp. S3-1-1]
MRIDSIHIYGFGKWTDQQFTFDHDGLIEIAGNNESGKTTLRKFISYILFGMKPKELERFIPKQGSTVGGRMKLSGIVSSQLTIERVAGKHKNQALVWTEDGREMDEDWLRTELKGIKETDFQAIYTFDAHDLRQIQEMDNQSLHEVLLAVGMTGTDRIYHTEKHVEKKLAEWFKPNGKKPAINQLLQELKDLQEKLTEAKKLESSYQQQLVEIEQIENQLVALEQEKHQLENKQQQIEKQRTHYQTITDYYHTNARWNRLDHDISFPAQGIKRWNEWKEALLPLKSEERVLANSKQEIEEQINRLELMTDEQLATLAKGVELFQQIEALKSERKDMHKRMVEIEEEVRSKLATMQINLTVEGLQNMELPFYLEEAWADLTNQLEKLAVEKQYIENEQASIKKRKQELREEKEHLLTSQIGQTELKEYQKELEQVNKVEQQEKYQKWHSTYRKQLKNSNILLVIGLVVAVGLFFLTDVWSVVVAIVTIGQNITVRLYGKVFKQWLQPDKATVSTLSEAEIQELERLIQYQTELQNALAEIDKDIQKYQQEQVKQQERHTFLTERIDQLEQKITEQEQAYPFLSMIEVPYWSRLYQQIIVQKQKLSEVQQLKKTINQVDVQLKDQQIKLDGLNLDVENLEQAYQHELDKRNDNKRLQARKDEIQAQLTTIIEKQKPYQEEINQLLQQAEVDTEDAFIAKGEKKEELDLLQEKRQQLTDSLVVLFSEKELQPFVDGAFADKETLERRLQELAKEIQYVTNRIKQAQATLSDRKASVKVLENNEDVSILKHQLAMKQEELQESANKWAVYQVASANLAKAKTTYSQKYLPQVMEQASDYFAKLTLGNYQYIYMEDEKMMVKDSDEFTFDVLELSQGTKDQLYIAIRFALSHVMASRLALPFLIDDGFVHFDSNRKAIVLEIIEELSKEHQLFYFTANPTNNAIIKL